MTDTKLDIPDKHDLIQKMFNSATQANPLAIKAISEDRIGAYGIIWGDEETLDSDGQYFTKDTGNMLDIFEAMGRIPWLVHHGADGVIKSTVIGEIDVMRPDDVGLWYEARVLEQNLYKEYVAQMIQNKKLFSSSGALPAAVKANRNGEITNWPIFEMTGTWLPAEFRFMSGGHSIDEIKAHYQDIGISVSESIFDNPDEAPEEDHDSKSKQDAEKAAVDNEPDTDIGDELAEAANDWLRLQRLAI